MSDKFSLIVGGVPTPATILPLLGEDHVNNHLSLGVPPPNMDTRTLCQVEVIPCKSEGIEPFNLVNSPPGQVEDADASLHTVNSPPCQVGVYPCKSEGIEPFNLVNSPPGQVKDADASSHTVNSPPCQVGVYPCKSEGIEPFNLVNSPPGQVEDVDASSHTVNSPLCQVGALPSHPINSPSGSLGVSSPMSCTVPASVSDRVTPVLSPSPPASVTSPPCFVSSGTASVPLNTTQALSCEQPMALPVGSDRLRSAFVEEVNNKDFHIPLLEFPPIGRTILQHVDNPDVIDRPGPAQSQVPLPTGNPDEGLGAPNTNNDSLPFLGDPEAEFFGE